VDDARLNNICEVLDQVAAIHEPFQLEVGNFGAFPSARKSRVLWVGLREKSGSLASLKSAVERELEPHGFEVERRNFHPHVTVGRVRRNASKNDLELLTSSIEEYELGALDSVKVDQIELVRSDLRSSGPIYSTLRAFPLGT
jgi:2'-5' RNA ligase